jgi:hypothetical protein
VRPTSFVGLIGLGIIGLIFADFLTHPTGTSALGSSVTSFTKTAGNQLIGVAG